MLQSLWRTVWRFLKKLKIELPYNPEIPLLGIYPEKTIIQKDTCTPKFIAVLFTVVRVCEFHSSANQFMLPCFSSMLSTLLDLMWLLVLFRLLRNLGLIC